MDMVRNYENSHKWQDGKHTVPPSSPPWALLVLTEAVKAGLLRFSREGLSFLLLKQCCCISSLLFRLSVTMSCSIHVRISPA